MWTDEQKEAFSQAVELKRRYVRWKRKKTSAEAQVLVLNVAVSTVLESIAEHNMGNLYPITFTVTSADMTEEEESWWYRGRYLHQCPFCYKHVFTGGLDKSLCYWCDRTCVLIDGGVYETVRRKKNKKGSGVGGGLDMGESVPHPEA